MGLDRPADRTLLPSSSAMRCRATSGCRFFHRRPVTDVIAERLPATIELTLAALLLALLISIPLGVLAAVHKGGWLRPDRDGRLAARRVAAGLLVRHPADHAVRGAPAACCPSRAASATASEVAAGHRPAADRHAAARAASTASCRRCVTSRCRRSRSRLPMAALADARDAHLDARGAALGLRHLRRGQGPVAPARAVAPRAEERADADRHGRRARDRLAARRQHDRRDGVRLAGPGAAGRRERSSRATTRWCRPRCCCTR